MNFSYKTKEEEKNIVDHTEVVETNEVEKKPEIIKENNDASNGQISKSNISCNSKSNPNNIFDSSNLRTSDNSAKKELISSNMNTDIKIINNNDAPFNSNIQSTLYLQKLLGTLSKEYIDDFVTKLKMKSKNIIKEIIVELLTKLSGELMNQEKGDDDIVSFNKSISNNIIQKNNDDSYGSNTLEYINNQKE